MHQEKKRKKVRKNNLRSSLCSSFCFELHVCLTCIDIHLAESYFNPTITVSSVLPSHLQFVIATMKDVDSLEEAAQLDFFSRYKFITNFN